MIDLIVFTQYPKSYAPQRFLKESSNLGLNTKIISYLSVKNLKSLPTSKFVILREPDANKNLYSLRDKILTRYINKGSKVLNKDTYLKWSILDKKTQYSEFINGNIPHIKSLRLRNLKNLNLDYPFIAKNKLGSHGDGVYKINNKEDLKKVLLKHKVRDLIFQEFLNSGFDLRVIVIDSKVLGIMKRTPKKGEFLSNFSKGGKIQRYEGKNDESELKQLAIKVARHFKLEYVGVDLMMGNDKNWKVLEVNRACQFKGFEKAIKTNVAKNIINFLRKQKIR